MPCTNLKHHNWPQPSSTVTHAMCLRRREAAAWRHESHDPVATRELCGTNSESVRLIVPLALASCQTLLFLARLHRWRRRQRPVTSR